MSDRWLEVSDLGFEVDGSVLLQGVNLEAGPGEVVGVIGPNGAGKSTLLRLLGGDLRPTAGIVRMMGQDIAHHSPRELASVRSMLGANPPADVPFTVRTVVEAGRYVHRDDVADTSLVDAVMVRTGVEGLASRVFRTLSTGEQARVMIARILAQDSPIALLDEPTSSLDISNAEEILTTLSSGSMAGRLVISVLHDLNAAAKHCDRLWLMSEGSIVAKGAPFDVLNEPLLAEVYGHRLRVIDHPFQNRPLVLVDG